MKTLKQICKKNWYIIATTLLMVICSEVLRGIMRYNSFPDSFDLLEISGNSVLRVAVLIVGVVLAFIMILVFDSKFSGAVAAIFTVNAVLFSELILDSEEWFYLSLFAAVILLLFYYVNSCLASAIHTLLYYIMVVALAVVTAEEIGFFIILSVTVILFFVNRGKIAPKSALMINYIFSFAAIIAMVCMFVESMDSYFGIKFVEGDGYHLESLYLDTRPFGKAEYYYHRDLEMTSLYNLAKIFRHFGYVAGTAMCVLITLFALSFFVRCFGNDNKMYPTSVLAAIMISVRCIAGFFENFSIISGMRVRIPILSDDISGFLLVGIMLGFMLVTDDIIHRIINIVERIFKKLFIKQLISEFESESETESESDKPHLTLVGSKEDDDV